MNEKYEHFELSYYIAPIGWNGKEVTYDGSEAEKQIRELHEAGIEWAGLNGVRINQPIGFDLEDAVSDIRNLCDKYEIKISSFHFAENTMALIGESQIETRSHIMRSAEIFSKLEPKSFVVHAGWLSSGDLEDYILVWRNETEKHGEERVIAHVADNLKEFTRFLGDRGIYVAFETMGRFQPLGQKGNIAALLDMLDEPNAGYCLDSGHVHAVGESVAEWVEICGDRLFETHFHDNRALCAGQDAEFVHCSKKVDEHLSPGFGTISWFDVVNALRKIKFSGPVTFETAGWPGYPPVEGVDRAVEWWRQMEDLSKL